MKTFFQYAILISIPLIFLELLSGYYLLQSRHFDPAVLNVVRSLVSDDSGIKEKPVLTQAENSNNIFILNTDKPVRFHPFLDYTNAHTIGEHQVIDFFGFRNANNVYFTDRKDNTLLVLMTGGSECTGYTHPNKTISESLQEKLQNHTKKKVTVLNLCMNSYVLAHEMQAYMHLAYDLKPDLVITHSGWNDAVYGLLVDDEFLHTGLIYNKWVEHWLKPLYGEVKHEPPADVFVDFNADNVDETATAYLKQLNKYEHIATNNESQFLVGLQGYNPVIDYTSSMSGAYSSAHRVMKKLSRNLPKRYHSINFSTYKDIKYADSVHTEETSVDRLADIYTNYITEKFSNLL